MDSHPLVKSLKMRPFPNRASEMEGSDSKPAQAAHSEPARDPDVPCTSCPGPQGILGPKSSRKRSVKSSKPQGGWGWRLNLLRLRSETLRGSFLLRRDPASKESLAQGIPEDKWGGVPGARAVAVIAPWVGAQVEALSSFFIFRGRQRKRGREASNRGGYLKSQVLKT